MSSGLNPSTSTTTGQRRALTPVREVGFTDKHRMLNLHRGTSGSASGKRRRDNQSSIVVDYFYAMQHSDESICSMTDGPTGCDEERKRCFVLSPIGPEGSEVRQHADDVLSFIIQPALHSRAIECVRSDMRSDVGAITDSVYEAVFNWDLCVAVLTYLNPNVFYELALRQCVGLPVICMIEKGHRVPFDVADQRLIEYTLNPTPLFEGVYAEQLAAAVDTLITQDWKSDYAFAKFQPRICSAPMYFARLHDLQSRGGASWSEMIRHAGSQVDIMGMTLKGWKKYEDDIKTAAAGQCDIRIIMMDKDNPGLPNMVSIGGKQLEALRLVLDHMSQFYSVLAKSSPYITLRMVKKGGIFFSCVRSDKEMIYQPHFFDQANEDTPVWHCERSSTLYQVAKNDFQILWDRNEEDTIKCDELPDSSEDELK